MARSARPGRPTSPTKTQRRCVQRWSVVAQPPFDRRPTRGRCPTIGAVHRGGQPGQDSDLRTRDTVVMDDDVYRYLTNREGFRLKAIQDFSTTDPDYAGLLDALDEYVAHLAYNLSGKILVKDKTDDYLSYLLVTFIRGHFNVSQFTRCGELTDAGVLFRRQMELLARLIEVRGAPDLEKLLRKTPNVGNLKGSLRTLYGEYSAIAHGSDTKQGQLLGTPFTEGFERWYPVFPRFSRHAYVLVGHVAFSIVELHVWLNDSAEELDWPLDTEWFDGWWKQNAPQLMKLMHQDPYEAAEQEEHDK